MKEMLWSKWNNARNEVQLTAWAHYMEYCEKPDAHGVPISNVQSALWEGETVISTISKYDI